MDTLLTDVRVAVRNLRKTPGFTLVAVLTLALGIGANTSVFTLINAALFRPVPAPDADRLVWVAGTQEPDHERGTVSFRRTFSHPEFRDYEERLTAVAPLGAYHDIPLALGSGGVPERLTGLIVSAGYFQALGFRPVAGRFFHRDDDGPGARPVVVIAYSLWQRRFARDAGLLERDVTINGRPFTVVGVAPRGFSGLELGAPAEMWVTFGAAPAAMPGGSDLVQDRGAHWLRVFGRLKPGVTVEQADAETRAVAARLAAEYPRLLEGDGARILPLAGGLDPSNRRDSLPVFALLMIVPLLVLLIACANVANLMLARAAARRREVAIRLSLGATRRRLLGQLLTEALALAFAAAAAGLLVSVWLNDMLMALSNLPPDIGLALAIDGRVLGFTALIGLATTIFFGLVPALGASRPDLVPALKDEGGGLGRQVRRSRLVSGFVVAQVALSLVLLVTAGLFLRTLGKALRVDPGLETRHAVALSFDLRIQGYDREQQGVFYSRLLERVRGLPGVTAASLSSPMPLGNRLTSTPVAAEGPNDHDVNVQASFAAIWPEYFAAIGAPLLRGREFTARDRAGSVPVAIVNATLAQRLWPDQDPIGKRLLFPDGRREYLEVVGVARDGKYHDLTEAPRGFLYVPERQRTALSDITLLVRTSADPRPLIPELTRAIHALDPNLPLFQVVTLEAALRDRLDQERGASSVLGVFGVLALLLAALGLYGVMAYGVAQRTREVGVRMALGAGRDRVLRQFVGEGLRLAGVGIAIGVVMALGVTRVISRFLYGVTATDAVTFALCAAMLGIVAAVASFVPARRAARVDPMVALRYE